MSLEADAAYVSSAEPLAISSAGKMPEASGCSWRTPFRVRECIGTMNHTMERRTPVRRDSRMADRQRLAELEFGPPVRGKPLSLLRMHLVHELNRGQSRAGVSPALRSRKREQESTESNLLSICPRGQAARLSYLQVKEEACIGENEPRLDRGADCPVCCFAGCQQSMAGMAQIPHISFQELAMYCGSPPPPRLSS